MTRIAGVDIKPGSRYSNFLSVGNRAATHVKLPFTVIRGSRDGPTICITAGVHGTEYVGIDTAIRLSNKVKPDDVRGTLIVVPTVNVPGFEARTYVSPIDGVNIQGSFPGKSNGTISHLISYTVFREFISKSDYYLDLHGGDIHESEIGFAGFFETGNRRIDARSEQMAKALGFEYIWHTSRDGPMPKGSSWRIGPETGIPSALAEFGSGDKLMPEEVSAMCDGVLNVMRHLRIVKGRALKKAGQKTVAHFAPLRVTQGGLFHVHVAPGDIVSRGDVVGEVINLQGEKIETVRSPTEGVVLALIHNPVVNSGDETVFLGSTKAASIWNYS
jgi:hypothetical protein